MYVKDEIVVLVDGYEKFESMIFGKGIVLVKEVIDIGKKFGGIKYFIIE